MSLLQRIAESQGASQQEAQGAQQDRQVEQSKPNAVTGAQESRAAYGQQMVEGEDRDLQEEAPSKGEQKQFTEAERAMAEIVYGQASNEIIKSVGTNQDPVANIGKLAAALIDQMTVQFPDLSEDVMFALGESAVEQIVDLAEANDDSIQLNDDQMAEALSIGVTTWMDTNPEKIEGGMNDYMNGEAPLQMQTKGPANREVDQTNVDAPSGVAPEEPQAPIERM